MDHDMQMSDPMQLCGYPDAPQAKQPLTNCSRCRHPIASDASSSAPGRRTKKRSRTICRSCESAASPLHRYPTPEEKEDFTCYGELKSGGRWGCGRRFNRLKDFAHHLRTRSGRKCIQPLYDEERGIKRQRGVTSSRQSSIDSASSDAYLPGEATGGIMAQLEDFSPDFSFQSYGSDCDTEGSPQMDIGMSVDDLFVSPYLLENGQGMRDATLPGTSYMAWWQSYMGSIATSSHNNGLGANV